MMLISQSDRTLETCLEADLQYSISFVQPILESPVHTTFVFAHTLPINYLHCKYFLLARSLFPPPTRPAILSAQSSTNISKHTCKQTENKKEITHDQPASHLHIPGRQPELFDLPRRRTGA